MAMGTSTKSPATLIIIGTMRATQGTNLRPPMIASAVMADERGEAGSILLPPCAGRPGRGVNADLSAAGRATLAGPGKSPSTAHSRNGRGESLALPSVGKVERAPSPRPSPARAEGDRAGLVDAVALQRLLAWLSPSFPVGAYSYSHGLEWAIEDGTVVDAATLVDWIGDVLRFGAGHTDAVLFAHAYRAAGEADAAALSDLIELAAAFQPSKERHLEATAQGQAFLATVAAAWPNDTLARLLARLPANSPTTYALAVAIAAAAHAVPLAPSLKAFLSAFVANLVSAGVRAIPIGQTDGQRIIANAAATVEAVAGAALAAGLDALGGAAFRADIASMKHETQYTRLFRS